MVHIFYIPFNPVTSQEINKYIIHVCEKKMVCHGQNHKTTDTRKIKLDSEQHMLLNKQCKKSPQF